MKTSIAILGFGNRGQLYAEFIPQLENVELAAVCDINFKQLDTAVKLFGMNEKNCFLAENDFFKEKRADILIVSTQDKDHFSHVMQGLRLGYHILLEKPISVSESECVQIGEAAIKYNRHIAVCHVLRYTLFFSEIKKAVESGAIGQVVTINQTENVGYWHQAHSFVRGNWHKTSDSAPMILAKCCHDLDILAWLINKDCQSVSSFGGLHFFNDKNAPKDSADYCYKCSLQKECPYNCIEFYKNNPDWFNIVLAKSSIKDAIKQEKSNQTNNNDNVTRVLSDESNPYSKCVFKCDNDVVDHQVVNLLFEGGITSHLTMTAFSEMCTRTIKIHGTYGEICGDFEKQKFTVTVYGKGVTEHDMKKLTTDFSGHGGGDKLMLKDFVDLVNGMGKSKGLTTIDKSILSHKIAFKAEESRLQDGKAIKLD